MSTEAIEFVKKPAVEFLKDSWRLVKRCTKPDRNGAPLVPTQAARSEVHRARSGRGAPRLARASRPVALTASQP